MFSLPWTRIEEPPQDGQLCLTYNAIGEYKVSTYVGALGRWSGMTVDESNYVQYYVPINPPE